MKIKDFLKKDILISFNSVELLLPYGTYTVVSTECHVVIEWQTLNSYDSKNAVICVYDKTEQTWVIENYADSEIDFDVIVELI